MSFIGSNETLTLKSQEKQADLLPKLKEKISTPEGVPRLFDLVRVQDERMKLAFFAALRNTVVAKDLDQVYFNFCMYQSHSLCSVKHNAVLNGYDVYCQLFLKVY